MKTILYNTTENKTVGKIREGSYSGIWNSAMSELPGWTPEYIVELEVIENEKPATELNEYATSEWVVEGTEYKQVWTVHELSQEEIELREAQADWPHPEWAKRIVAPIELILDDMGIKMYGWFQLNGFPVEKVDDTTVHLYCNVILPQHQAIVDELGETVTVEDRLQILA